MLPQHPNPPATILKKKLNWLFTAVYADGSEIVQDQDDKCLTRTDGTGSAFTDVLAKDGLVQFSLRNETGEVVGVDLLTGNFTVNGREVQIHNQFFEPQRYKLELVYFRETRVNQTLDKDGNEMTLEHFVNRYFIGWKTTVNGRDKQVTLAVG